MRYSQLHMVGSFAKLIVCVRVSMRSWFSGVWVCVRLCEWLLVCRCVHTGLVLGQWLCVSARVCMCVCVWVCLCVSVSIRNL